jgi:hypothetical protein
MACCAAMPTPHGGSVRQKDGVRLRGAVPFPPHGYPDSEGDFTGRAKAV